MTTVLIRRPARRAAPPLPAGEIILEPPPAIPQPTGARWQQWLSVLPVLAGTVATAMMFGGREGAGTYTYVVGAIFGLSTLGMLVTNWGGAGGPRKAELMRARRDYLRYLSGVRRRVHTVMIEQRSALHQRHPDPRSLWAEAMGARVWERRPTDADFGIARVGVGPQSLATPLVAPVMDSSVDLEPVTAGALHRFLDTYAVVPDLPVSLAVGACERIIISDARADAGDARALARAILGQLATFHAPEHLAVAACVAPARRRDWEWIKWLPHALHPHATDPAGPRRLVTTSVTELDDLLTGLGIDGAPHVVAIVDGVEAPHPDHHAGMTGVTLVEIGSEPPPALNRSTIALSIATDATMTSRILDEQTDVGRCDMLTLAEAEALARQLAPLRSATPARDQAPLAVERDLAELLGVADVAAADIATLWAPRPPRHMLRVPIGTAPTGEAVHLDIKEAAQDGMGPHGLVVGATGSGKSELLRTLVLGLAATHSPEALNFVLVDFKGGATFASLDRLPHTSALITNLAEELPLVDRMNDALSGELTRRQEVLRRAGNIASLRDYDQARAAGADLLPLPSLLLVCDEFTEMLTAKPDFIDLFLQIGRIGRSIGVHLLLATQRLEEGRLRGLETNLSYRIALRTFSAAESRAVLGSADAAELPAMPGHGFLKVGTATPQRFKAGYVSGAHDKRTAGASAPRVIEFSTHPCAPEAVPAVERVAGMGESLLQITVARLAGHGTPAHRVWLPPLAQPPSLDDLLGAVGRDPVRGLTTRDAALWGALRVPVAKVDKPFEQRRDVAWWDLSGSAGHVAIVGSPQSGKSTAARTVITALALTHTAQEIQFYCLDFGGGGLSSLRGLPHVGDVAGRADAARVRRSVGEVATVLADRERRFAARGIDSVATFRRLRRPAELEATLVLPEDGFGDVFLVVDGWSTLRNEYEDLEPTVVDIATRGLSYGVHVIATATRWNDFRSGVKDLFAARLELRLGDPGESSVDRRSAANVPPGTPGRGLTVTGLHALTALPRLAAGEPASLITAIATAWSGQTAPPVRMLPEHVPYAEMLAAGDDGRPVPLGSGLALPLGVAEHDLRPVVQDFTGDPHLVVFGDSECGKSSLLRSIARSITWRFAPEQARIVIIDYRRSLLGAVDSEHLIGYGSAATNTTALIESVAAYMDKRRPGAEVTPQQLRTRSWWSGPECFVLVDDYDLVASGPSNPLLPVLEHLAQARDLGLHLILARRAGGAGRALYEPILQRLRELATPGLVMAGDRDEGALVGNVRPAPQPPGRGWLVTRRDGVRLVQLAHLEP